MVNVAFKISERGIEYVKNMVEQITNHLTKKKKKSIWALSPYLIYQCKFQMDHTFKI